MNQSDRYADIIVDITSEKLDRVFQYRIPEEWMGRLEPGMVVEIPFGNGNRRIKGYVVGTSDEPGIDPAKIKPLAEVVMDSPGEEAKLVKLAAWMKQRYGCTMIRALRTVIPVKKKIQAKQQTTLHLCAGPVVVAEHLDVFRKKHQKARLRLLEALAEQPDIPGELAREKLNITQPVIRSLEEMGLLEVRTETVYRNPLAARENDGKRITLNPQQQAAVDTVIGEWDQETPWQGRYLLHGVTGSGKTEVYMELIAEAVRRGQQAIVLIPEIALTYQTVIRFYRRFGDRVSLINSRLSAGERYDQYERAKKGMIDVMVGPRSALFTPFSNLGIIVIDEEHEPAYQSESSPRYHARETAFERARMEGARVVLGSATPSLEAYAAAEEGMIRLLEMPERTGTALLPRVDVVDLRQELREGNRSIFSRALQDAIEDRLARREQIMLFLNRRGYAGFVSCRSCGHVFKCPHCDVSLSMHRGRRLVCHYCGHTAPMPDTCPECGSGMIGTFKAGTQQIEQEVLRLFPQAKVLRMDMDTTRKKDSHESILAAFRDHEADILVGTQMIVKGHDFPDVTLMGILAADLSLHIPDFRASERTFQLLTQAAGRAGRADKPGEVIIQSYSPDHYSIQCAAAQDYKQFYEQEISFRRLGGYPPAGYLEAVHLTCPDPELLDTACMYLQKFAQRVAGSRLVSVLGPSDDGIGKIQDIYRKVLYLKGMDKEQVRGVRAAIERYIEINEGFNRITVQYGSDGA